jgi:UrcA family protein
MTFSKLCGFVFVICALSAIAPASAFAAPASVTVRYGDIEADTDEGARILLGRIERAAREVCGKDLALRYPAVRRAYRACTLQTMHKTIEDIGVDRLHDAFVTRYGQL